MADGLPPISFELAGSGAPYVIVGDQEANDLEQLLLLAPNLADPHWLRARAQLINHLASGFEYEVILDPPGFEAAYMAQYNSEDPEEEVGPGEVRLIHYGVPDFTAIQPPAMEGDTLVFYAREAYLGVPYRVEADRTGAAQYSPMALSPEPQEASPDAPLDEG